ncbi:unnamed protein product [Tuber aestivum]|uniref:Uncharacterized protein n=1 Tax=Tuber aestivum TaxID=59557 RepID=A0A292Q858_9PEZI|nr:unnamed protein product [Tuber aestivum]
MNMRAQKYASVPDWAYGENSAFSFGDDISPYLESDLQVSNATLRVDSDSVQYSYILKDFKEGYSRLTNHVVHSSVNCSLIEFDKGHYWRWNNGNRTGPFGMWDPFGDSIIHGLSTSKAEFGFRELGWGEEGSAETVSEILRVSRDSIVTPPSITNWVSFLDLSNGSSVSPQICQYYFPMAKSGSQNINFMIPLDIVCNGVAWECWPSLTETWPSLAESVGGNASHRIHPREKFFHDTDLYRLSTVGNSGYTMEGGGHRVYLNGFSSSSSAAAANDGAYDLCHSGFFDLPNEAIWNGYSLWIAGLVARLPILAIIHANHDLPKYARGLNPNQTSGTAYLHTALEVDWFRTMLIAFSITGGQILAILAVLGYCKGIYTRDDSHLATAELLKTVITKFDDGKLMTGEELAASLDGVLRERVSYGIREGLDGGPPEVDLTSGLNNNFPPFPQKRRFWGDTGSKIPGPW